jgi:hypothetical protein
MNRMQTIPAVVCAILAGCSLAGAQNQSPFKVTSFSATVVMSMPGQPPHSVKIYRSGDKIRTDISQGGRSSYFLSVLSERMGYMVMGPGMCMKMSEVAQRNHPDPFAVTGKVQTTPLGTDTVDGHPTQIVQIAVETSTGQTSTMKAWEATDLQDFPVRIEVPTPNGTVRMDYKDVSLSAPPASLFEAPTNCRSMPMMQGMPHP